MQPLTIPPETLQCIIFILPIGKKAYNFFIATPLGRIERTGTTYMYSRAGTYVQGKLYIYART